LDNNGFVLLSERSEHTGKFFGQIDGTIMDSLVQDRIFRRIALMDFQGVCSDRDNPYNGASERVNLIQPISWALKYFISFMSTWFTFFAQPVMSFPRPQGYEQGNYDDEMVGGYDDYEEQGGYDETTFDEIIPEIEKPAPNAPVNTNQSPPRPPPPAKPVPRVVPDPAHARPCDLKTDLYLLQPDRLNSSGQSNPLKVRFCGNFKLIY
jgi:hypothetical protein